MHSRSHSTPHPASHKEDIPGLHTDPAPPSSSLDHPGAHWSTPPSLMKVPDATTCHLSTIPLQLAASTEWTSLLRWVLPEPLVCQGQCQILDYCRCKAEVGKERGTKTRSWVPAGHACPTLSKLTNPVLPSANPDRRLFLESAHCQQEPSGGSHCSHCPRTAHPAWPHTERTALTPSFVYLKLTFCTMMTGGGILPHGGK